MLATLQFEKHRIMSNSIGRRTSHQLSPLANHNATYYVNNLSITAPIVSLVVIAIFANFGRILTESGKTEFLIQVSYDIEKTSSRKAHKLLRTSRGLIQRKSVLSRPTSYLKVKITPHEGKHHSVVSS